MHEHSLCAGLVARVREQAEAQHYTRVVTIRLEIGPYAAIEPEALRLGFELASRGTLAEGARLELHQRTADRFCLACGASTPADDPGHPCPACGSDDVRITGDAELRIKDLEVI